MKKEITKNGLRILREEINGLTTTLREELGQLRQQEIQREEQLATRLAEIQVTAAESRWNCGSVMSLINACL
mgnify:CR=1 FL=1